VELLSTETVQIPSTKAKEQTQQKEKYLPK